MKQIFRYSVLVSCIFNSLVFPLQLWFDSDLARWLVVYLTFAVWSFQWSIWKDWANV